MTADFAIVTAHFGQPRKSVTISRNGRSRSSGIAGHDPPKSAVTLARNTHFGVSLSFVEKLLQQVRTTGNAAAKKQGRDPGTCLNDTEQDHARHVVEQQPDITLAELADQLDRATGVRVSRATLYRLLQRLDMRLKKSHAMRVNGTPQKYGRHVANPAERSLAKLRDD